MTIKGCHPCRILARRNWHTGYIKEFRQGQKVGKGQGKGRQGEWAYLEKEKAPALTVTAGASMFALFQRKQSVQADFLVSGTATKEKRSIRPESAASLLATPRRQRLLEHIWQRTSLSRAQFKTLYLDPLQRYAALVQQFPASEAHHHAYPGGMLDHGLEIVAYALKLRQSHLLPAGTTPEDQAAQAEAWTAATAYAALLHDIGKIAVDLHVEISDGSLWHPWHGPLQHPYRFRYRKDREYRLHNAASGLLYNRLLDREILDWLSGYPELWSSLLYVLAGQYEHAGVLGELVMQADRASVAQELGGDPSKAMAAPKHALQRKLLDGLRYLLKTELKLNQPQASDGWLTQDALWLVSKTVSDKLRAHLLSQGIDGIPSNNTAVFNVLQDHGILQATPEGTAIWKATVASETGWSHRFTLLRLAPALIWEADERPAPFAGTVTIETAAPGEDADAPTSPPVITAKPASEDREAPHREEGGDTAESFRSPAAHAVPDIIEDMLAMLSVGDSSDMQQNAEAAALMPSSAAACPSGEHFMAWLKQGIASHRLIINDAKALVHTVSDTAFLVSPGVFQRYAQEHPQTALFARQAAVADWQWVQQRFGKLRVHRKQSNGLNIWAYEVSGPRKTRTLHGYLLEEPRYLFWEALPNNPYLRIDAPHPPRPPEDKPPPLSTGDQ